MIIIPWLGGLVDIIVRGGRMQALTIEAMARDAQRNCIRSVVQVSLAGELARLGELKEEGVLNDAEFAEQKASVLSV